MVKKINIAAVILAAGRGRRFNGYKQFMPLDGKLALFYSLESFNKCKFVDQIVVVLPPGKFIFAKKKIMDFFGNNIKINLISGGKNRQASVFNALQFLRSAEPVPDNVFFHDAARPLVTEKMISKVLKAGIKFGSAVVARRMVDLAVEAEKGFVVAANKELYAAETPQFFNFKTLLNAHLKFNSINSSRSVDNLEILRSYDKNSQIKIVEWIYPNIKLTYPHDLAFVEFLLK